MLNTLALHWPIVSASVFPIIIYLIVGLSKRSRATSVKDYFIYDQQVKTQDYANTSVGYALQMAAIFLFAYWGILYGLGALWTALFWGLGFAFLYVLLPRFLPFHDSQETITLHQYLANQFKSKHVRWLAAIATIVGLWGTMMAELDYTMQIYAPLVSSAKYTFIIQSAFLIFGVIYIIVNGYKAEVNTERLQVPFAYAGLMAVLVFTLPAVWIHSGIKAYTITAAIFIVALIVMLIGKVGASWRRPFQDWQVFIPLVGLLGVILVSVWIRSTGLAAGNSGTILDQPIGMQLKAQGYFPLISLFIANALWMPVDFSTWQRVASVEGAGQDALKRLRRGTWRVMFESPASWCLGVVLGLIIHAGGFVNAGDEANALPSFSSALHNGNASAHFVWASSWLYPLFIVACISIMLSTVDSIISAIAFTADQDLPFLTERKQRELLPARLWTVAIMLAGLIIYPFLRYLVGTDLPTFLYAAYSMQLSLLVIVLLALYHRRLESRAAIASLLCGFGATLISGYLAKSGNPNFAVLPPMFAVLGSIIGYAIFFRRRALQQNG
ncbi:MAG: hypothetical protein ACXW1F_04735 [Halobacteriota archaeon]